MPAKRRREEASGSQAGRRGSPTGRALAWLENAIMPKGLRRFHNLRDTTQPARKQAAAGRCGSDCGCSDHLLAVTSPGVDQPLAPTEKIFFTSEPSEMSRIRDEKVQLVVWRRPAAPQFATALSNPELAPGMLPAFAGLVTPANAAELIRRELLRRKKRALGPLEIDALVSDIEQQVRLFAELTKSETVHVKLERIGDDGCAFWHQDCVDFRLVTTYRGPCTQFVHPKWSDSTLRRRKFDSKHAKSLTHHDVALFKGRGKTALGDALLRQPGVVHRSPRLDGSGIYRVVLVLDIPQKHIWNESSS